MEINLNTAFHSNQKEISRKNQKKEGGQNFNELLNIREVKGQSIHFPDNIEMKGIQKFSAWYFKNPHQRGGGKTAYKNAVKYYDDNQKIKE